MKRDNADVRCTADVQNLSFLHITLRITGTMVIGTDKLQGQIAR